MLLILENRIEQNNVKITLTPELFQNKFIDNIFINIKLPKYKIIPGETNSSDWDITRYREMKRNEQIKYSSEIGKQIVRNIKIKNEEFEINFNSIELNYLKLLSNIDICKNDKLYISSNNYIKIPIIFGQISSLINNLLFSKRNQFNSKKIELEILLLEPDEFIFNRTFEINKTEEIGVDSISLMKLHNDNDEILNLINHKKILVKPNENFTYFFNIPMEEIDSLLFFCEKDSPNIFYNNGEQEVYINNLKEELLQYKFINIPKFINEDNDKEKYFKIKFKEDFFENRRNELVNRLVHFIWFKDVNPIIKNEINNYLKNKNSIEINFLKTDFLLEKIKYEDKCAISFEEFEDKEKVQLCITCSHAFKFEAIQKWKKVLQDKNEKITCPYCRSNLGDKYYQIIK